MLFPFMTSTLLFPAHAGMNRFPFCYVMQCPAVPRTRGDEPGTQTPGGLTGDCSPHTRG